MRVLVEQTEWETREALRRLGILWEGGDHVGKIGVHQLMGGADAGDWHLYPDECAVLIGTQDMLLSRALNRGYGSARARWPTDFGLLNQDCLWVMDEVQLMDVGLATSGQLQSFRDEDRGKSQSARPCFTWWMSATLQPEWLAKSPETKAMTLLPPTKIAPENRRGFLWDDVRKPCVIQTVKDEKALANLVAASHSTPETGDNGAHGPTLVVVNTVERAVQVYEALCKDKKIKAAEIDLRLIHSRFRPAERSAWRIDFLNREVCAPGTNRIIVATQVVEAGVDISAGLLITELAPWPSLVQRFGRCARWGGEARVIVADFQHKEKKAAPYDVEALAAARVALAQLDDVSPLRLEEFEEAHPSLLPGLYPYEPRHLLLRHELDQLFDTTPDLTGADVDISRFIRSGEERDLHVFWEDVPDKSDPPPTVRPCRDALCAVPFLKARDWLCGTETQTSKSPRLKSDMRAWVWDWLDGCWRRAERRDLYPGQTVLVAASCGGYSTKIGWALLSGTPVGPIHLTAIGLGEQADAGQDDESLSIANQWRTIATHGREVAMLARTMADRLVPELAPLVDLSSRVHDPGKGFIAFQGSMKNLEGKPARNDLAKVPDKYWEKGKRLYHMPDGTRRPGFRHELASALLLFAVLERHAPDHPAMLGPWREILERIGMAPISAQAGTVATPTALEREIIALDAEQFNLLAFLVCAHHGKIGIAWHACPADQDAADGKPRLRGLCDGDTLPAMALFDAAGQLSGLPELALHLAPASAGLNPRTGQGWTERVLDLLHKHGAFRLAWLTALLRAADQRASRDCAAPDPLLQEKNNGEIGLEGSDSGLAMSAGTGKTAHPLAADSPQCSSEHGLRGGTGGSGDAGSGTRQPAHATRHIETRLGRLTYAELAPHLAKNVQTIEEWIDAGEFDASGLDDTLVATLHGLICEEFTPQFAGWRGHDVQVGRHSPPPYHQVPLLMREYGRDLVARLAAAGQAASDLLLEALAFAEGRLLSIHPFADFNGRATRVFLRLLLRRLDLPAVDIVPPPERWQDYLDALHEADRLNWRPLMRIWQQRFEQEVA